MEEAEQKAETLALLMAWIEFKARLHNSIPAEEVASDTPESEARRQQWLTGSAAGAPSAPACFAELKYRSVDHWMARLVGATHAFWFVQDAAGAQLIISAGPTEPGGKGLLMVWVSVDTKGGVDNASARTFWKTGCSAQVCEAVDRMLNVARAFGNLKVKYGPRGPNSNSAARHLGGVAGFSIPRPPGAIGWSVPIETTP